MKWVRTLLATAARRAMLAPSLMTCHKGRPRVLCHSLLQGVPGAGCVDDGCIQYASLHGPTDLVLVHKILWVHYTFPFSWKLHYSMVFTYHRHLISVASIHVMSCLHCIHAVAFHPAFDLLISYNLWHREKSLSIRNWNDSGEFMDSCQACF